MKYFDVVLATSSPRRRELIKKIKWVRPLFCPVDVSEVTLDGAQSTAEQNARLKGEAAARSTSLPVLAFDTVVGTESAVFGKPKDKEQAISMLRALCGRTHTVVTAVFLRVGGKIIEKSQKTYVTFGAFNEHIVYNYVESGAPFDKAGGYNIDDECIKPLIIGVDGDYDNVVGLPVRLTEKLLEENLTNGKAGHRA